jgi:hypothetical protein
METTPNHIQFKPRTGTKLIMIMLTLALTTLACGFQTNFPTSGTVGPDMTDTISVPEPDGNTTLTLSFGAGELNLNPGAEQLVQGTAIYNVADFKPEITTDGGSVNISQGDYQINGFPAFNNIKNIWDFKLGSAPMDLNINAGAYKGVFNLGGLALTNLSINDGAAEVTVDFATPNPEKLSVLSYKTGASNVTLKNLGNANFASLMFESGAGNYKLDFNGQLQRDGSVSIRSGMSNLTLIIPAGTAATVKVNSGLSNIQFPSGWTQSGETYTQTGSNAGPALTIVIEMGAGNVQISQ